MGFLVRWVLALVLLAATYNPTQYNFIRWAAAHYSDQLSVTVLLGLFLTIGYIIYLRATLRSIGLFGMLLVASLAAAIIWVMFDQGLISLSDPTLNTWIGIVVLSLVLAIGLSWSIVRRRISGQADVDDVDG